MLNTRVDDLYFDQNCLTKRQRLYHILKPLRTSYLVFYVNLAKLYEMYNLSYMAYILTLKGH